MRVVLCLLPPFFMEEEEIETNGNEVLMYLICITLDLRILKCFSCFTIPTQLPFTPQACLRTQRQLSIDAYSLLINATIFQTPCHLPCPGWVGQSRKNLKMDFFPILEPKTPAFLDSNVSDPTSLEPNTEIPLDTKRFRKNSLSPLYKGSLPKFNEGDYGGGCLSPWSSITPPPRKAFSPVVQPLLPTGLVFLKATEAHP